MDKFFNSRSWRKCLEIQKRNLWGFSIQTKSKDHFLDKYKSFQ